MAAAKVIEIHLTTGRRRTEYLTTTQDADGKPRRLRGIDPHLLTVDVRESFVNVDLPSAASNLAEFRARGGPRVPR
ncbi:MAG: hypothetical protein ABI862_02250 [Ilumatobacteraceae bacterium]